MGGSPEPNKCYTQPTQNQQRQSQLDMPQLRFINTGPLANLFSASADKGARALNQ
ncbi:DNA-binding virion core phosphoprotein [Turkeypox virus]|uniref:DNA-binding virion core phosphoprotein n=1 Tax=Turkeypox virus TaxID=336486 RepID=A0A0M3ZHI2_9POXV|nr:DNA-binding virion core phosphoprotein [Turkeypox virus]ALA62448.1 DNA-binding virion core phosphoprotein [Turkeypox virus]